jgi:hypothetical protein
MQIMLSRLAVYTRNKHLIVNTSKSEVVHFNSAGENRPVFDVGGATLHHKGSFRYLGMVFYKTLDMSKSAEHASRPFLASSAYRIRRFVREHALADRLHTSLWLAKTNVIPAGMFGSQVWGTGFLQAGREFSSPLSTLRLHFLKGTLGVKQSTTDWAVLRECGHGPLQFYWFRSAVKLFNSMLNTNSDTLRRVVQADLNLQPHSSAWLDSSIAERFSGTAWV